MRTVLRSGRCLSLPESDCVALTICASLQLPTSSEDEMSKSERAGMIAGITIGAIVLAAIAAAVVVVVLKRRRAKAVGEPATPAAANASAMEAVW